MEYTTGHRQKVANELALLKRKEEEEEEKERKRRRKKICASACDGGGSGSKSEYDGRCHSSSGAAAAGQREGSLRAVLIPLPAACASVPCKPLLVLEESAGGRREHGSTAAG